MARNDDSVRFQITMSKTMTERVQKLADDLGISRSAAVNVLVSQGIQAQDGVSALTELMNEVKKAQAEKAKGEAEKAN